MIAKKIAYAIGTMVILSSGAYLFVYLYRWEWNRALIAGVIFVAAEIALVAMMLLDKLRSIEERISGDQPAHSSTVEQLRDTAPAPKVNFKWLSGGDGDLQVFVPVLMGAGVIFSGVAWIIERVARMTARPALEHGLAVRLQPLSLPEGGFLNPLEQAPPIVSLKKLRFRTLFYGLVLTAVLSFGVDALGDLTQNRPELDVVSTESGAITLDITRSGWVRTEVEAAQSLWAACLQTVSPSFHATGFVAHPDGLVSINISPVPGTSAERRLTGCLQDATLDNVLARVVSFGPAR